MWEGSLIGFAHIASIDGAGRRAVRTCLVLCVLGLVPAACGGTASSSTTRSFTAPRTTLTIRSCKTAVYGQLAPGWRSSPQTVRAGVVSFLYGRSYREAPARRFRATGSGTSLRYPGQKLLVVVDGGAVATVVVALKDRARVALQYQPVIADPPIASAREPRRSNLRRAMHRRSSMVDSSSRALAAPSSTCSATGN